MSAELRLREPSGSLKLETLLDYVARVLAPAVGLTYFLGFLVVNLHLDQYGANFLGVFAPQYLTAGLWAMYPFFAGMSMSGLGPLQWDRNSTAWRRKLKNTFLGFALVVGFLSGVFAPLILVSLTQPQTDQAWTARAVISLIAWAAVGLIGLRLGQPVPPTDQPSLPGFRGYLFKGLVVLLGVVAYCMLFSIAYPMVPARLGGGGEVRARLLLNPGLAGRLDRLEGFETDSNGMAVRLLLVTDNMLLIVPPTVPAPALVIKRQDVDGILLEPRPRPERKGRPTLAK